MSESAGKHKIVNEEIFEDLFKKYYHALCCYAVGIIGDAEDAKDIVNNFFGKLWDNRENIQITVSLESYIYGSIRNNCLKDLENKKVKRKYSEHVQNMRDIGWLRKHDDDCPHTILTTQEMNSQIEKDIDSLPAQCREVFLMWLEGLSYQEIADELGIALGTVRTQMTRAKTKLRKSLMNQE